MSTFYGTAGLGPAPAKRQAAYSPLEAYWNAFQDRRKRERLRTQLCRLTDSELLDIGVARSEIDCVVSNRSIDPNRVSFLTW